MTCLNELDERLQRLERIIPELETALECLKEIKPALDAAAHESSAACGCGISKKDECPPEPEQLAAEEAPPETIPDRHILARRNAQRIADTMYAPFCAALCQELKLIADLPEEEQNIYLEVLTAGLPTADGLINAVHRHRE